MGREIRPASSWEEPGFEIARHATSTPVDVRRVVWAVMHWPGVKIRALTAISWLRQLQRISVGSHGYSLVYSWAIWRDGTIYAVRGWDHKAAANSVPDDPLDLDENAVSVAILFACDSEGADLTREQIEAAAWLVEQIQDHLGRVVLQRCHGDLEGTACPGAQVRRAVPFRLNPTPQPRKDPDVMPSYLIHHPAPPDASGRPPVDWTLFRMVGVDLQHVAGELGEWLDQLRPAVDGELSTGDLDGLLALIRGCRTVGELPGYVLTDTVRSAWKASQR